MHDSIPVARLPAVKALVIAVRRGLLGPRAVGPLGRNHLVLVLRPVHGVEELFRVVVGRKRLYRVAARHTACVSCCC